MGRSLPVSFNVMHLARIMVALGVLATLSPATSSHSETVVLPIERIELPSAAAFGVSIQYLEALGVLSVRVGISKDFPCPLADVQVTVFDGSMTLVTASLGLIDGAYYFQVRKSRLGQTELEFLCAERSSTGHVGYLMKIAGLDAMHNNRIEPTP